MQKTDSWKLWRLWTLTLVYTVNTRTLNISSELMLLHAETISFSIFCRETCLWSETFGTPCVCKHYAYHWTEKTVHVDKKCIYIYYADVCFHCSILSHQQSSGVHRLVKPCRGTKERSCSVNNVVAFKIVCVPMAWPNSPNRVLKCEQLCVFLLAAVLFNILKKSN